MFSVYKRKSLQHKWLSFILTVLLIGTVTMGFETTSAHMQIDPTQPTDTWLDYKTKPSGDGTQASPYLIYTPGELMYAMNPSSMGNFFASLENDLDLSAHEWWGQSVGRMSNFNLEGNNHTISNLYMNRPTEDNVGFCREFLTAHNVNFSNVDVTGKESVGAVVGSSNNAFIYNCNVLSGTVTGESAVGGFVGTGEAYLENCINRATIVATGAYAGAAGLIGNGNFVQGYAKNCSNFGDVIGYNSNRVAGLICAAGAYSNSNPIENCYVECTVVGKDEVGGLTSSCACPLQNTAFKGKLIVTGTAPTKVGLFNAGGGTHNIYGKVENCFAVAEMIFLNASDTSAVVAKGTPGTISNSFFHTKITKSDRTKTESRKILLDGSETTPFENWTYSEYLNDGYPFPTGMFAVGGFGEAKDVVGYLADYNFYQLLEVQTMTGSTYGTDKYVEMGRYPQTYVGSSMNTTLEGWYSGKTVVDTYTVDNGTSATPNVYNAYTYTDGKRYVRVPLANLYITSTYEDGTAATTSATWFKVEPIKWLILNYTDFQNGAAPVVVAEKALAGKVAWNKAQADQNLWSGTSNIRTWLNGTFYNDAFNSGDKRNIVKTSLQNNSQSSNNDGTGESTTEKVWLLSYNEANGKYFTSDKQRLCSPTDFAIANYSYFFSGYPTAARPKKSGTTTFWLRSAYLSNTSLVHIVSYSGGLSAYSVKDVYGAVRPALTINRNAF